MTFYSRQQLDFSLNPSVTSKCEKDLRPCGVVGCPELITKRERICSTHKNSVHDTDATRRKAHPRNLIYKDPRWQVCKRYVYRRDNWTCVYCKDVTDYMNRHRLLSCDHANEGGVMKCPDPFDPAYCVTACGKCSGKKDGARGGQRSA